MEIINTLESQKHNLKEFNESENAFKNLGVANNDGGSEHNKNTKQMVNDILENLYLILFTLIPIVFYPILYKAVDHNSDVVSGIFANQDIMLLPIPYIIHCILLINRVKSNRWKNFVVGWNILIAVISMLCYFILKFGIINDKDGRLAIIWTFMVVTVITGIIGSVITLGKEKTNA